MNIVSLILFATALVAITASDSAMHFREQEEQIVALDQLSNDNRRRHLLQDSRCTLFRKCITLPPTVEHPYLHHKDSWVCELSKDDIQRLDVELVDIVDSSVISAIANANATSGESTMTMSRAIIDTDTMKIHIPLNSIVEVKNNDKNNPIGFIQSMKGYDDGSHDTKQRDRRQLAAVTGTLPTLVVRVTDKFGAFVNASIDQLVNDVFEDEVSLKSQMEACSYNKLKIVPFEGKTPNGRYISNGIVDITMDYDITSGDPHMDGKAKQALRNLVGNTDNSMFGLVLFCFPPGKSFLAYAYVNSKYSFYNNQWCGFVGGQMHEVGHNLNLAHSGEKSGENTISYGDTTGMMSSINGVDDLSMCYNPVKSFQLGWYEDQVDTTNPLDGQGRREYILNGVADYTKNPNSLIVLRLSQTSMIKDFYIGYNSQNGINQQTMEHGDMVTITRKESGGPAEYGQSTKVAHLLPGQQYCLENFNGQADVQVAFIGIKGGDAKIAVTDNCDAPRTPFVPPAEHCKKFTIELTTDRKPEDNFWIVVDTRGWGEVAAISPAYTEQNKKFQTEICLPMGPSLITYNFSIFDHYGDGMCCGEGKGSYKGFNELNEEIFSGDEFGKRQDHFITVPKDPNPAPPTNSPTSSPTNSPTQPPKCEKYIVEVRTDKYPEDTAWNIVGNNNFGDVLTYAKVTNFAIKSDLYKTEVCLTEGNYDFNIFDDYASGGICCGDGPGYYRIQDPCGGYPVDSGIDDKEFTEIKHQLTVDFEKLECFRAPTAAPIKCKDTTRRKFRHKRRVKKRNCKNQYKAGLCDKKIAVGKGKRKYVWEICQKSCKICP